MSKEERVTMKLSIITPYYKTLDYTLKLAQVLEPQLNSDIEWIIIDDGCNEKELDKLKAKVIHLFNNSGNASKPRNVGLDNATGDYIAFVDSDDMVYSDYIKKIMEKIDEGFDYCYIGWECGDYKFIIYEEPPEWNVSVWNCIYNRNIIGDTRFDEKSNIGEDYEFNQIKKGKRANILSVLYTYHWDREGSLTTKYGNGEIPYTRE